MRPNWTLLLLLAGCGSPPNVREVPVARVGPERADVSVRPPSPEPTLREVASRFYAELAADDRAAAAATLQTLERFDLAACLGGGWIAEATAGPDGTTRVAGARALVAFDPGGRPVQVRTFDGCLIHSDPDLVIEAGEERTTIALGAKRFTARAVYGNQVRVSRGWVLVEDGGDTVAISRSRQVARRLEVGPSPGDGRLGAAVAGRFLAFEGDGEALHVQRDDAGAATPVRGCDGQLLGAASVTDEEVVVHTRSRDPNAPADSQLCWVARGGVTRRKAALGAATCGLARAVPCAWQLQAVTPTELGFGSMRGMLKTVDARSGAPLPWALPPGYRTEGGSPSGFSRCAEGLCASVLRDDGELALVVGARVGSTVSFSPLAAKERRYCDVHGLPVPRELCGEAP